MSDDDRFERDLRATLLHGVSDSAPAELRRRVRLVFTARGVTAPDRRRTGTVGALAATVLIGAALVGALVVATLPPRSNAGPSGSPAPSQNATESDGPTSPATGVPSESPTRSATPTVGPEVDDFGLIDAEHGWAFSGDRFFMTSDGGATWRYGFDMMINSALVSFPDPRHGWVGPSPVNTGVMKRTTDGGETWQDVLVPKLDGATGLRFFDDSHGLLAFSAWGTLAGSLTPGSVWSTSDGGATWTKVAEMPIAIIGQVTWAGPSVGWAKARSNPNPTIPPPAQNELYVTRDGGKTWQLTAFPSPPAGWQADDWLPVMGSLEALGPQDALLPVWYGDGTAGDTQLLLTHDAGATWTVAADIPSLGPVDVAALDGATWLATVGGDFGGASGGAPIETLQMTADGGRTWAPLPYLPYVGAVYPKLLFADRLHGWILVNATDGANGLPSLQLYATADGGQTWHLLSPQGGPTPTPMVCSANNVLLGREPTPATGTVTDWFNVFPTDFEPGTTVTLTFDTPVLAWPGEGAPDGPITTFSLKMEYSSTKLTFRPVDPVKRVVVRVGGGGCTASTTVDFAAAP
jgi:photosystem II stability/assembly factor-like uncharacterized protein